MNKRSALIMLILVALTGMQINADQEPAAGGSEKVNVKS